MLKKRVEQLLASQIVGVGPEAKVSEVISLMRSHRISCVPVLKDGEPQGIFTERNVVERMSGTSLDFLDDPIREHMTSPVITARKDMYVYEVYNILMTNEIRHLVVVDEQNKALGVLTQSDIIEMVSQEYHLDFQQVADVMSKAVFTSDRGMSLGEVVAVMLEQAISCVVVAENGRAKGILTERDIARLVVDRRDVKSLPAEEVMSRPVITVDRCVPIHLAARTMLDAGVRRLVVVDGRDNVSGVVTQTDIVRNLETKYVEILKGIIRERDLELTEAVERLEEKTLYLDSILSSAVGMGVVATDMDLRVTYYNPVAGRLLGYSARNVLGRDVREFHERENMDTSRFNQTLAKVAAGEVCQFSFERHLETDKRLISAQASCVRGRDSEVVGYVLMLSDVTEARRYEANIKRMAYNDDLTGLPNRAAFNERLVQELARADRNRKPLALMFMDLDHFKEVNDTLGHLAGDALLQDLASRLRERVRKSDTLARIGGDEFVLVLPEIKDSDDALTIAGKIVDAMEPPFAIKGHDLAMRLSIGVALYPEHGSQAGDLMAAADTAMYQAKELGHSTNRSNVLLCSS